MINQDQTTQPLPSAEQPQAQKKARLPQTPKRLLLKPKQALFVSFYTNRKSETFGNATQSALKAGYGPEYARKITAVMSENVSTTMAEALDQAGLTDEVMAGHHRELMNLRTIHQITVDPEFEETTAKVMIEQQGYGFIALRKWLEYDKKGNEREKALVLFTAPDGVSKKGALDMAYKLKRHYPAERMEHTGPDGGPLIIERAPTDGKHPAKDQAQAASG